MPTPRFGRDRVPEVAVLAAILGIAALARLWDITAGVPHAVAIDEPHIVDRALRIMRTGDWNPHLFDYPTLVIYLYTAIAIVRFLLGATRGEWRSLDTFDVAAVYGSGRVVAAIIGVATVWLTFRLGRELASRRVAIIGALLLAVSPMHVRESHFMLADVPVTACVLLTLWLATRAAAVRRVAAYGLAGAAAGLAAVARYNGIVAAVAVLTTWLLHERQATDRWRKLAAAGGALALVFVIVCPFALLDLPHFLDGVAAQLSRAGTAPGDHEAAWLLYLKHLSLSGWLWLPVAATGMVLALTRAVERRRWISVVAFMVAYYCTLPAHWLTVATYALPLVPPLCLFAAMTLDEAATLAGRWRPLASGPRNRAVLAAMSAVLLFTFVQPTVRWLDQQRKPDTRAVAAAWMKQSLPAGASVAVENAGPAYLDAAGFQVRPVNLLSDRRANWYRANVDYLVISSPDANQYAEYTAGGTTIYQIAPSPQHPGPPITIVKLPQR